MALTTAEYLAELDEIFLAIRSTPLTAREVAARWRLDRSQAYRRLRSLEAEHPALTSSLEVGPHGAARRVWRWRAIGDTTATP